MTVLNDMKGNLGWTWFGHTYHAVEPDGPNWKTGCGRPMLIAMTVWTSTGTPTGWLLPPHLKPCKRCLKAMAS